MRKWVAWLLTLVLLLSGCTSEAPVEETGAPGPTVPPTEPAGYYAPESQVEDRTAGAVRYYPLNRADVLGIVPMGDDLVLFSGMGRTTLTRLSGENLYISHETELDCSIYPGSGTVQVSSRGVSYFDYNTAEMVLLNTSLDEVGRVTLPAEAVGPALIAPDRNAVYYTQEGEIRVLDVATGIHRLLRQFTYTYLNLDSLHWGGRVLRCTAESEDGVWLDVYISAETGDTLYEMERSVGLTTDADTYVMVQMSGDMQEVVFGTEDAEPRTLTADYFDFGTHPLPEMDGVVLSRIADSTLVLDYFDLSAGKRTASTELLAATVCGAVADPAENAVWLLAEEGDSYAVYRWSLSETPVQDDQIYSGTYYAGEAPDQTYLEDCLDYAARISETYGVEIRIADKALTAPKGYSFEPEYQAKIIYRELSRLDLALSIFPAGFLREATGAQQRNALHICLVRGIEGEMEAGGLQYWIGSDAYIALAAGDDLEQNLYHELAHVIDTRVMSVCGAFDQWSSLNPKEFDYDYDYAANAERTGDEYLQEGNEAFIDVYSMSFPREDRARIMEYAIGEGNARYFRSETMQRKLALWCQGIREAFGLEESPETFLWEQYLVDSE